MASLLTNDLFQAIWEGERPNIPDKACRKICINDMAPEIDQISGAFLLYRLGFRSNLKPGLAQISGFFYNRHLHEKKGV